MLLTAYDALHGVASIVSLATLEELSGVNACAVVATAFIRENGRIYNVWTSPAFRRQGLQKRLMHLLLTEAVKQGIEQVELVVDNSNLPAICLYRDMGFGDAELMDENKLLLRKKL